MRMRGKPIATAKLDMKAAEWARDRYFLDGWSQRRIADKLGVTTQTIGRIVRNESWKDFSDPFREDDMTVPELTTADKAAAAASLERLRKMGVVPVEVSQEEIDRLMHERLATEVSRHPDFKAKQIVDDFTKSRSDKGDSK